MKKIYLDSNVFISFVREEIDPVLNLRYVESGEFFALCAKRKYVILLSYLFFNEVKKVISLEKEDIVEQFKIMAIRTELTQKKPSEELVSKISRETGIHLADATHIAIAKKNNADLIVTWNIKDFKKAAKIIASRNPTAFLDTL